MQLRKKNGVIAKSLCAGGIYEARAPLSKATGRSPGPAAMDTLGWGHGRRRDWVSVLNSRLVAAHGLLVCARLVPGPEVSRGVHGGN